MTRSVGARWVVMVKPLDDHPAEVRIFGPWWDRETAITFRDKIRAAVDKAETDDDFGRGYAWVVRLERPLLKPAKAYAVEGEGAVV